MSLERKREKEKKDTGTTTTPTNFLVDVAIVERVVGGGAKRASGSEREGCFN